MAGSYNHIVTDDGNLGSNEHVVSMLENGGDVFEAVEELYGMIWYLAAGHVESIENRFPYDAPRAKQAATKLLVEVAHKNYKLGLEVAKEVHAQYPDNGRGDE
jgi:hypothetical protein